MLSTYQRSTARAWRRPLALGGALIAAAGLIAGFTVAADASGGGSTTAVHFVNLATPFKLFTNKALAANSSYSPAIIGGSTTVPYNATTVELSVSATSAGGGVMNFYPAGNIGGGSGQFLSWGAGGTDTQTIAENVGIKDELTFALQGGAAHATASIVGYSTQVTDGDVSGLDGSGGQVMTNNGSGGAAWADPSIGVGNITSTGGSSGQVLTNTGTGAAWQNAPSPTVYTASPTNSQWLWNSDYSIATGPSASVEWFTRYATISAPAITQSVLDTGTVDVYIDSGADFHAPHPYQPLPLSFPSGTGYNFEYAFEPSVGQVELEFFFPTTAPGVTTPNTATYNIPTLTFKVVVNQGHAG